MFPGVEVVCGVGGEELEKRMAKTSRAIAEWSLRK